MTARAADRLDGRGKRDAAPLYLWLLRRGGTAGAEAAPPGAGRTCPLKGGPVRLVGYHGRHGCAGGPRPDGAEGLPGAHRCHITRDGGRRLLLPRPVNEAAASGKIPSTSDLKSLYTSTITWLLPVEVDLPAGELVRGGVSAEAAGPGRKPRMSQIQEGGLRVAAAGVTPPSRRGPPQEAGPLPRPGGFCSTSESRPSTCRSREEILRLLDQPPRPW